MLLSLWREIQDTHPWFLRALFWSCLYQSSVISWMRSEEALLLAPAGDPHSWSLSFKGLQFRKITGVFSGKDGEITQSRPLNVGEKPSRGKWWIEVSVRPSSTLISAEVEGLLESGYHLQLYFYECSGLGVDSLKTWWSHSIYGGWKDTHIQQQEVVLKD